MEAQSSESAQSEADIRRSLFKNSGLIMGCRVVTAATSLLMVPFITSALGYDGFGAWEYIMAVASLCAMFQQSVNGTLLWRISNAHGIQDFDAVRRIVRIGAFMILCLLCTVAPLVWIFRTSLSHGNQIPARFVDQANWILPAGVTVMIALVGFNDIMGTVISGCQKTGVVTIFQAIALVVNYLLAIVLIRCNFRLEGLLFGMIAGNFVASFFYIRTSRKLCPGLLMLPAVPSREELKSVYRYWGLLMIGNGSAALRDQTDKLVLGTFASAQWVGYYGTAARVAFLVLETARFFYSPLLAAAGSMHAANRWPEVKRLYENMIVIVGVIAGVVTVIVGGLHQRLILLWMGEYHSQVALIAVILLAGNASAVILTGPGTAICRAIGKVWVETSYVAINLVGNLILTIVLVKTIGPIGTVIASGSTWAVSALAFTFILPRVVDLPKEASAKARWFLTCVFGCSLLMYFISNALPKATGRGNAAVSFFALAGVATVLYVGLIVATGLVSQSAVKKLVARISRRASR